MSRDYTLKKKMVDLRVISKLSNGHGIRDLDEQRDHPIKSAVYA